MHPDQCAGHQEEQQHEATGPQAGEIVQRAECDRQHEAAEPADHADEAADRTDVLRIVNRDVLVDGGLAQRHEEAEHEHGDEKRHHAHFHVEVHGAGRGADDVVGWRIGQHEGADHRDEERPVHHPPRAIAVGEMAAIGAEHARREREQRRCHAGSLDVDAVDVDQVLRQPQRQCDEGAEHEEVIEREAPDLHVLQRLELEPRAAWLLIARAARLDHRIFIGEQPEGDAHDADRERPHLRDGLPAISDEDERRDELRHRSADIAGAENAERRALLCRSDRSARHRRRRPRTSRRRCRRRMRRAGTADRCAPK